MNVDLSVTTTDKYSSSTGSVNPEQVKLNNSLSKNITQTVNESDKAAETKSTAQSADPTNNKTAEKTLNINANSQQVKVEREQLELMAEKLQEFVGSLNRGLEFSVDEDSGRDVIKVIDRESKEVVRQYPSEEVLDLIANLSDAAGNFINSKA